MRFDFTDLNLFRHIVEAGSITHGAERAHLALAAASTRIRKMERRFGAALLVRGRAGRHADAGRPHAACSMPAPSWRRPSGCRRTSAPYARGLAGQVRVLSNTNALTEFLPETLSSFLTAYPDISVDLEERLSRRDRRADRRRRRRHRHRRRHGRLPAACTRFRSAATASCWWSARNHPLASRSAIGFAEVLDYDFVGLDRASAIQRFLADKASRIGRAAAAARAAAQLRCDLPAGRMQCRRRHRAGDDGAARATQHGDQAVRADRRLGAARTHHLRARRRGPAALRAAAGRSSAGERVDGLSAASAPSSRDRGSRRDRTRRRP